MLTIEEIKENQEIMDCLNLGEAGKASSDKAEHGGRGNPWRSGRAA